jgi:hypothetical protein
MKTVRIAALSILACFALAMTACSKPDVGDEPPPAPSIELDPMMVRLEELVKRLEKAGFKYFPPQLRLPDLKPNRPGFTVTGNTVEFVFKVRNTGDADAGPFLVKTETWLIDSVGNNSGPIYWDENWPGVPQGTRVRSDEFLPPGQRLQYDISSMTRPIGLAMFVTVDPADERRGFGAILEQNDGINDNSGVYTADPDNPSLPWLIN